MDTGQNLNQRIKDEQPPVNAGTTAGRSVIRENKMAMAKRGLRTLGIAVSIPVLLTLTNIYFFGTTETYNTTVRPNWVPPIWAFHVPCLGSAFLMGLCGWMVWADGGLHRSPGVVGLYLGQFVLGLAWDPLVFKMGANWGGLIVAIGLCWALLQCYRAFKGVNQMAGDLVLPCLGWAGLLALVNLKCLLV